MTVRTIRGCDVCGCEEKPAAGTICGECLDSLDAWDAQAPGEPSDRMKRAAGDILADAKRSGNFDSYDVAAAMLEAVYGMDGVMPPTSDGAPSQAVHTRACVRAVGEIARQLGLHLIDEASEIRPAAMSYVKPSELYQWVHNHASLPSRQRLRLQTCACTLASPCSRQCSCASPLQSGGCLRCATYGSSEQRQESAESIAKLIPAYAGADLPARSGAEDRQGQSASPGGDDGETAPAPSQAEKLRALLKEATDWLDRMAQGSALRDGPSLWEAQDFVQRARATLGEQPRDASA